mgnify:CR=1 FL=1
MAVFPFKCALTFPHVSSFLQALPLRLFPLFPSPLLFPVVIPVKISLSDYRTRGVASGNSRCLVAPPEPGRFGGGGSRRSVAGEPL